MSFANSNGDIIVTCLGDRLKVIQISEDTVLRSRYVKGSAMCLYVREREIFIGFYQSNKIIVYDVIDLNEIRSIILQGIQAGDFPWDVTVTGDTIVVCVGHYYDDSNDRALIIEEKNGKILSELSKPTERQWYVGNLAANVPLGVIVVVWYDSYYETEGEGFSIAFYSLLNINDSSFLIVEVESAINRIRISNKGDTLVTGNHRTGVVGIHGVVSVGIHF